MARVISPAPAALARMTEPSQDPGCRPHLSTLMALICPSYGCIFAEDAAPAMIEATSANENILHRSKISTVLILLIGHLPRSSHQELYVLSLPERTLMLIHPRRTSSTRALPTPGILLNDLPQHSLLAVRLRTTYTASEPRKSRDITRIPPRNVIISAPTTSPTQAHCSACLLGSSGLCNPGSGSQKIPCRPKLTTSSTTTWSGGA